MVNPEPRLGVEGWRLVDLDMADTLGTMIQLVEPADSGEASKAELEMEEELS